MLKVVSIAAAILAVLMVALIAYALYDHEAFVKVLIQANEKMHALGGGITNGRRSAEGVVMAWSHDPAFDTAKLGAAMTILRALDKDRRVEAIRSDFRNSGVTDADMSLIHGLSKLESVDLSQSAVTRDGVAVLLGLYPSVRVNTNDFTGKHTNQSRTERGAKR